jgi:hypothetical protein
VTIDWNLALHADELLLLAYLIVWAVREIVGLAGRRP